MGTAKILGRHLLRAVKGVVATMIVLALAFGVHLGFHARSYAKAKHRIALLRHALLDKRAETELMGRAFTRAVARSIVPYWYGTPWSFNGTTENPRGGSIACGAFVATVLRDAGLNLMPREMTVLAAEEMILGLVARENIRRFQGVDGKSFLKAMKQWGPGLYQIGLDQHTGLLLNEKGRLSFIHSTRRFPYTVIRENASKSKTLLSSRYRVAGKLSADRGLLEKWVKAAPIATPRRKLEAPNTSTPRKIAAVLAELLGKKP